MSRRSISNIRGGPQPSRRLGLWRWGRWWFVGVGATGAIGLLVALTVTLSGPEATGQLVPVQLTQPASGSSVVNGPSLPDFQLALYQGQDVLGLSKPRLHDLLGKQPLVMNFWASNCPPCTAEIPEFEKVWQKYKDKVMFIGLDIGRFAGLGGPEDSKRELRELGVTYPAAPVPDIESMQRFGVQALPSTYFVTAKGEVNKKWAGVLNQAKLTELVEDLLDAQ